MTTNDDPRLKPAHPNQTPTGRTTTGTNDDPGEGVKAVSNRRRERKRAWDEMSEIDRAVLLETVRQRRKAQEHRRSIENEVYRLRSLR